MATLLGEISFLKTNLNIDYKRDRHVPHSRNKPKCQLINIIIIINFILTSI